MSRGTRLLSNTAILGVGTFASKLLVFLLMPFYTSILSTSEFGVADIVSQTANLLIPIAAVGICDGIFRYTLDTKDALDNERKTVFSSGMAVLALGSVATIVIVQLLRFFDIFDGYVWLIAFYVIFANFHSAAANFIRAEGKTPLFAIQGILNTVLTVTLNVLFLLKYDLGAYGYVLSVVISDLVITVFLVFAAKLWRVFSLKSISRERAGEMLRFSIPYIPTTMMWLITSSSDRYIVTAYCGTAENGLYAAAYKLPTMLTLVCGVFIEAWQFSAVKDSDEKEREEFFGTVFKNYMSIIFMGASALIVGARIFTGILLSDDYYLSWQYVPILVMATAFSALVSFMGSVYFLEKKSVMSMMTSMSGAIINIILNFIAIPRYGAMGAAIATFVSYLAVYAVRAYDTRRYVNFDIHNLRVTVNVVVLFIQAIVMINSVRYNYYIQIALALFMLIFNGAGIFAAVCEIFKKTIKKSQKN